MPLSAKFSSLFSSKIQTRGRDYFWSRRVKITSGSSSFVGAEVRGTRTYLVDIDLVKNEVRCFCECPHFESDGVCKHLWATILAAEAAGLLADVDSRRSVEYTVGLLGEEGLRPPPPPPPPPPPNWRARISEVAVSKVYAGQGSADSWPAAREVVYLVDIPASRSGGCVHTEVAYRDRKQNGEWAKPKGLRIQRRQVDHLPDPADRDILGFLAGAKQLWSTVNYGYSMSTYEELPSQFQLLPPLAEMVLRKMCDTGRCYLRESANGEMQTLLWDDAGPWQFRLALRREADRWLAEGVLIRGEERMDLAQPLLLLDGGFVFTRESVALLDAAKAFPWIAPLQRTGRIEAVEGDQEALLAELLNHPQPPPLDVPEELRYEEVVEPPKPRLQIARDKAGWRNSNKLHGQLSFQYQKEIVEPDDPRRGFYHPVERKFIIRDLAAETGAASRMQEVGFRYKPPPWGQSKPVWELAPTKLPKVVLDLVPAGWEVHAEGNLIRRPGASRLSLSSGIDWFELRGEIDYGGAQATLPDLLKALRRGENMVKLDDGTYGMLPEDWLTRFGALPGLGSEEKDHIRFRKNQAGLLDAFLAARPDVTFDETFRRAREHLRSFEGIPAAEQPEEFVGQLRGYQLEGLGWMHFLREFGFGGCLADDMGVGKTAQVLALLQTRRGKSDGPSLVVVPKSLVFNWKQEAERFAPNLRVLDHTGMGRNAGRFENHDVVLTTYGTLRRDVTDFKDIVFDYVVLDEAQAIKNADTESAKAARLLNANNRLVLSGTPVENHLGELWSLFEFLNPGMLGTASVFKLASGAMRNPEEETRLLLAKALRPFILRRTKGQVAKELPVKSEQTLYCEMEPAQRKLYDDLRDHYRASLLGRIESVGLAKSKMHVLEALLRLRQAACHPGLVDPGRTGEPSAKLDILMMQLSEVLEENHKVLVFSQFTSFLAILKDRLDEQGIVYEYLDGKTRDRQTRVERFQTDPDCKLFLISLKAGGLGLNLTAAEYVFLLDPWWNPAVEAQAIDRAHRIGQSRQVFAYRLIARGTVEEKVLELQKTKRNLADAIIGADNSIIRTLAREDLELLLS